MDIDEQRQHLLVMREWLGNLKRCQVLDDIDFVNASREKLESFNDNLNAANEQLLHNMTAMWENEEALTSPVREVREILRHVTRRLYELKLVYDKEVLRRGVPVELDEFPVDEVMVLKTLQHIFKIGDFLPVQRDVVYKAISTKQDIMAILPTGGGKSICYQLPGVLSNGVTIVVSPLCSLIIDQMDKLTENNIKCVTFTPEMSDLNYNRTMYCLENDVTLKFVFVTPEKYVRSEHLQNTLQKLNQAKRITRLVIDEAHCVSLWGHDFRPAFQQIAGVDMPGVPKMVLTATATTQVKADICEHLKLCKPLLFESSVDRANLSYVVIEKQLDTLTQVVNLLKSNQFKDKCGIIYCFSRVECEEVSTCITNRCGINCKPYHAGLSASVRLSSQHSWMNGETTVICATNAFGMGIDKEDVRFVMHYSVPKSIESYHQESGRAGRDYEQAISLILFKQYDVLRVRGLISRDVREARATRAQLDQLDLMSKFCNNKTDCRRLLLVNHFQKDNFTKCSLFDNDLNCDNCCRTFDMRLLVVELPQKLRVDPPPPPPRAPLRDVTSAADSRRAAFEALVATPPSTPVLKRGGLNRLYDNTEKKKIVDFLVKQRAHHRVKSITIFRLMEEKKLLPGRSAQAMKSQFNKNIIRNIDMFCGSVDAAKFKSAYK